MAGNEATTPSEAPPHADAVKQAIVQTFDDGCGVQIRPYTNREGETDGDEVIVGIVSVGGAIGWSAFVALAEGSAVAAAKSFIGMEIPFEDDDMCEAISEVVNLFSVRLKAVLDQSDLECAVSMPSVVRASSIDAFTARAAASETTCFRSPFGTIWVGTFASA